MGRVRDVIIARRAGFCYGVREAIDHARTAAAQGKRTHTHGHVVHNEGVIAELAAQGVRTVGTVDEVDEGSAVVIRAHGVAPAVIERARMRGLDVIDGTCTWVLQEQRALKRLVDDGYTVVLLGTPSHPEVVGLLGFAPDAIVVDDERDWERVPQTKRLALLSQSTQPLRKFQRLAAFLVGRSHELKVVNTICPVTIRRQEDTLDTARQVERMVVVGGWRSANTRELARLCESAGSPVLQIESADEIRDGSFFGNAEVVGVTGGTSTPIEDLQAVAARIYSVAGAPGFRDRAEELADRSLQRVAASAYRSTSLPALRRQPCDAEADPVSVGTRGTPVADPVC